MASRNPLSRLYPVTLAMLLATVLLQACMKESETPVPPPRQAETWLHRVNSIAKAKEFRQVYPGYELDVHFDTVSGNYYVKHDFSEPSVLTLNQWLDSLDHPEAMGLWLDFKNLSPAIAPKAFAALLLIRETYQLTTRPVVVESSEAGALPMFDTLNFRVSYYIPWFDPSQLTPEEEESMALLISGRVSLNQVGTISGYLVQKDFMTTWFPGMNKLLWYLDSVDPAKVDSVVTLVREDPTVEVLLVAEDGGDNPSVETCH